jgi:hypothetical protein
VTARRSTRLLLAPAVLALLALAALMAAGGKPCGVLVAVAAGIYWLVSAVADYSKRLVITDEQLRMSGYVGRAVTVRSADAVSCTYVKYRVRERGAELFFLEIRDVRGTRLKIWRYGWGRNRRRIFESLGRWLAVSPAVLSPDARRVLDSWAT